MKFLNRSEELRRLDKLATLPSGGLAVVYGRRRVGKTRLLLEWVRQRDGLYTVADLSAPDVQRRYFAAAIATRLTGFADVDYPDWAALLTRLAREAGRAKWRGPLVIDELPYLVSTSPELPSLLQRFIDHEAKAANLVVALAGSSQRMMQGLVLSSQAPLYGRAREIIDVRPIEVPYLRQIFPTATETALVEHYAAWGGIPWYWELASESPGTPRQRIDRLVLDPLAPLHMEPDRLLLEETPSALEVRPVLDAIGAGAHRVSEIGARLGRPATSLSRPIGRASPRRASTASTIRSFGCGFVSSQRTAVCWPTRLLGAGSPCSTSTIRTWWAPRGRISAAHACRAFVPRPVPVAADLGRHLRDGGPVPRQHGTSSASLRMPTRSCSAK
jgi:AAA+ ATPase superfamily predicted ATPase